MTPEQKKQADQHLCAVAAMISSIEVIARSMSQTEESDFDLAINGSINLALDHLDKLHDVIFAELPSPAAALDVAMTH